MPMIELLMCTTGTMRILVCVCAHAPVSHNIVSYTIVNRGWLYILSSTFLGYRLFTSGK